jgi:hypothetical protein
VPGNNEAFERGADRFAAGCFSLAIVWGADFCFGFFDFFADDKMEIFNS